MFSCILLAIFSLLNFNTDQMQVYILNYFVPMPTKVYKCEFGWLVQKWIVNTSATEPIFCCFVFVFVFLCVVHCNFGVFTYVNLRFFLSHFEVIFFKYIYFTTHLFIRIGFWVIPLRSTDIHFFNEYYNSNQ